MTISQMTTIEQLTAASELTRYSLQDLVNRAAEIAENEAEYQAFVTFCKGYERTIKAGSWSKAPATVK
jgi:hypothetical protein